MSWVNDKATIAAELVLLDYKEVANDEDTEDQPFTPHQHFYFNLKKTGAEGLALTSKVTAHAHTVRLECYYVNNEDITRDMNSDSFDLVMEAIVFLDSFGGEIQNSFEDIDEDHSKGILEFYFGFETC